MKRIITVICFCIGFLYGIPCVKALPVFAQDSGCDVITLTNGKQIYCKVMGVGFRKVTYTGCDSDKKVEDVLKKDVSKIDYSNHSPQIINSADKPKDSINHPFLFIGLSSGFGIPALSYRSTQTKPDFATEDVYPAGFAGVGLANDISVNAITRKGYGAIISAGYFLNSFDSYDFLTYSTYDGSLSGMRDAYYRARSTINSTTITVNGKQHYNNYSIFFGFNKLYYIHQSSFGFSLLVGKIFINTPAINAIVTVNSTDTLNRQTTANYNWQVSQGNRSAWAIKLGINTNVKIANHLYLLFSLNYILSSFGCEIPNTITDANGNIVQESGVQNDNLGVNSGFFMLNFTGGIEYGF